jgi:hypothetical protein
LQAPSSLRRRLFIEQRVGWIATASRASVAKWALDDGFLNLDLLGFSRSESTFSMACEA